MTDDDAVETETAPDHDGPSGAFVARIWHDPDGLRARVRHTGDLGSPNRADDEVALLRGAPDHVIDDLVDRFHHWADNFAAGRAGSPEPTDGVMTPE